MSRSVTSFACAFLLGLAALAAPSTAITLKQVQSHMYMIATGPQVSAVERRIGESPTDLIILSGGEPRPPINRALADPTNNKIIVNYIDVTETTSFFNPPLWANGKPAIAGAEHPAFPGLYSVQYWTPAWRTEIYRQLDAVIAGGYDGVFLDLPFGDWEPGNTRSNPVRATSSTDLVELVRDIRTYVNGKNLSRPFYLIANEPFLLVNQFPTAITVIRDTLPYLDAAFNENVGTQIGATDGTVSFRSPAFDRNKTFLISQIAPIYKDFLVLGNDYTTDVGLTEEIVNFYSSLGWVPSVTNALQDSKILTTGPFVAMAVPDRPTVTAKPGFVNLLAGGNVAQTTLIGADKNDIFIGGPGRNTITGGIGDNTIYVHPENVLTKNTLVFEVAATGRNLPLPTVTVKINGQPAQTIQPSIEPTQSTWQRVEIDTSPYEPVTSVEFVGTGIRAIDPSTFSNAFVRALAYQTRSLNFTAATFAGNATTQNAGGTAFLNSDGATARLSAPTFPIAAPAFADTTSTVDGGDGTNTAVYRAAFANYSLRSNADGSVTVTSSRTNEGPDTLRNVQYIRFTDQTIALSGVRPSAIFSSAQSTSQSFLRFFNTGTSAGTATVNFNDGTTGQPLGQWTSPSIPASSEQQYTISTIENALGTFTRPSFYTVAINANFAGQFQHVLWRPADGTLTNLSTCAAGVTADRTQISGVHSSLLGSGYPSTVAVNNTGATATTVTLGVYDARNGSKLGTYVTTPVQPGGQVLVTMAAIEAAINVQPSTGMFHYVVKAESAFTGFLQHLLNNAQVGVVTDMTTTCDLRGASTAAATSLSAGAIFSTAQPTSQSFLRFHNTGSTAGTVIVSMRDASSGQTLGAWTSPSLAANAEQQFPISVVEQALNAGAKPSYYSISAQSGISGYFQHVLWRPSDGTLTNLSTCAAGVAGPGNQIGGVHSTLVGAGYVSTVVVNNTGASAITVPLGIYDARNGARLGTYTTASIPGRGQRMPTVTEIEQAIGVTPTGAMYHYVIKADAAFTGFLQHIVNNAQVGVVTDMTTACALTPG